MNTTNCKKCKGILIKGTKVCPFCGQKQGSNLWIIPVVIAGVIFMFGSCSLLLGSSSDSKNKPSTEIAEKNNNSSEIQTEQSEQSEQTEIEEENMIDVDISNKKFHVKYLRHEVTENQYGEQILAVYYEFTNNDDESQSYDLSVQDKAFQNGIELNHSYIHLNDESKLRNNEIQPGYTVTVCAIYEISDTESEIELQVEPWISFSDKPSATMTITPQ